MKFFLLIVTLLVSRSIFSQENGIKLLPPDQGYIYHGAFPFMGKTEDIVTKENIILFESLAGKDIAWVNFSNNWYNGIKFPSKEVELINSLGKIPYIRLMPRSNYNTFQKDTLYSIDNILKGRFDKQIRKWAQDAAAKNIPLMLDFGPEMNGNWFQWSGIHNGGSTKGPENYVSAYRHIIDIFRDEKAINITWIFHPNNVSTPDEKWNSMEAYYPGDDYIDWIGMSVYGSQRQGTFWYQFDDVMIRGYESLKKVSTKKPMAVLEFGVIEDPVKGNKAEWIVSALSSLISKRYPLIKAISYWQSEFQNTDGTISDLKINSSEYSLRAYRNLIQSILFLDKVKMGKSEE